MFDAAGQVPLKWLLAGAALPAGLVCAFGVGAADRTCADLSCGENALCVMLDAGPRCICQFGFSRDRARRQCVPMDKRASGPLPAAEQTETCSPGQVERVEEVLQRKPLKEHCLGVERRTRRKGRSYGELLLLRYKQKRNIGYGMALMLAPLFAGGAAFAYYGMYRIDRASQNSEGTTNVAAGFGYILYTAIAGICTNAAAALLFTGIGYIVRGNKMLERLEPLASDERASSSGGPRLTAAPYLNPSGAGGVVLRVDF